MTIIITTSSSSSSPVCSSKIRWVLEEVAILSSNIEEIIEEVGVGEATDTQTSKCENLLFNKYIVNILSFL